MKFVSNICLRVSWTLITSTGTWIWKRILRNGGWASLRPIPKEIWKSLWAGFGKNDSLFWRSHGSGFWLRTQCWDILCMNLHSCYTMITMGRPRSIGFRWLKVFWIRHVPFEWRHFGNGLDKGCTTLSARVHFLTSTFHSLSHSSTYGKQSSKNLARGKWSTAVGFLGNLMCAARTWGK